MFFVSGDGRRSAPTASSSTTPSARISISGFRKPGRTSPSGPRKGALNHYSWRGPHPVREAVERLHLADRAAAPLPQRWALGYQQCRWGYASARGRSGTLALELPGAGHPAGTRCTWTLTTWTATGCSPPIAETFPDFPGLHGASWGTQGVKAVTIIDPGVKVDPNYSGLPRGPAGGLLLQGPARAAGLRQRGVAGGQRLPGIFGAPRGAPAGGRGCSAS